MKAKNFDTFSEEFGGSERAKSMMGIKHKRTISSQGFSLIELTIAFLLLSMLGMGLATYLKRSQSAMRDHSGEDQNRQQIQIVQKMLREDLQQAVFLNPSCNENPAPNTTVNLACANLKARGAIVPFPAHTADDMTALTTMAAPANLTASPAALTQPHDAIRILSYDFDDSFNCRLNRARAVNPSQTGGTGSDAEVLWAEPTCTGLAVGKLFVIVEVFDTDLVTPDADDLIPYSNLFQITQTTTFPTEIELQIDSNNNIYNQSGALGLAGFSNEARIFPVKWIEWAYQPSGGTLAQGIYRREIIPSSTDLVGKQAWRLLEPRGAGLQFSPVTITTTGAVIHQRSMQWEGNVASVNYPLNNGLEDIRGVSPRFLIQSDVARSDGETFDNPLTTTVETSAYAISEMMFNVMVRNAQTN